MSEERESQQPVAGPCEATPERLGDYKKTNYDMIDPEEEIGRRWPELEPVLGDCAEIIRPAYREADEAALRYQRYHKRLVFVAATCGMLAVLFAIVQLSPLSGQLPWVGVLEAIAAILAVFAVIFGLVAAFFPNWLFEREKAERCRVLKFLYLISPGLWSGRTLEERQGLLCRRVKPLKSSDKEALERWLKGEDAVLEEASPAAPASLTDEEFARLLDYYLEKQLCYQRHYFERQARRRHRWGRFTRAAPVLFFFLSILAALGHFGLDEVSRASEEGPAGEKAGLHTGLHGEASSHSKYETANLTLLMLAACLPVVGIAVRTLHTAHEFGRNAFRFESTSGELEQLAHELESKSGPQAKLEVLHRVEDSLRAERLEWLRLMKEAEWFG